tara:strand:- start:1602 stop:2690 length:1089 start_codon:yes stop_codon:yes gene_type:complete
MLLTACSDDENVVTSIIVGGPTNPVGNGSDPEFLKDFTDFKIGNIVSATKLASSSAGNVKFREVLGNDYNSITAENDMKMANMFPSPDTYDWSDGDAIVAYAKENNLRVHGHALVWHSSIPGWLSSFQGTDAEFEAQIQGYVKATVAHFALEKDAEGNSVVTGWDAVNEYFDGGAIRSSLFTQRIGEDYINKIFTWAREADSDVKLFYNDFNVAGEPVKRAKIIALVNDMISNNIPIDGVGMQMHFNYDWPTSDIPLAIQQISDLGLLVHASELDVRANPNSDITNLTQERAAQQATQYQNTAYYYTTTVPENQQYGITIWGFRDQDSWRFNNGNDWPLLYDNDFNTKASYNGFVEGLKGNI